MADRPSRASVAPASRRPIEPSSAGHRPPILAEDYGGCPTREGSPNEGRKVAIRYVADGAAGQGQTGRRSAGLFEQNRLVISRRVDRVFAGLMAFQWIAGIMAAVFLSPRAWDGDVGRVHSHVWAAVLVGGLVASLPVALALLRPGAASTRHVIAAGQMLMGALLIHLSGGRIETHFHIFGSLAFLALYRDWRVLITASAVAAIDHLLRGLFWPQSVYGVLAASGWRWAEHVGWVVFEDVVLVGSCRQGVREMREVADRQAQLEATREGIEATVRERTEALRETTERVLEGEARTRAILGAAADGIVTFDDRGIVESLNDAAEAIFGLAPGEMVGREIASLIPAVAGLAGDEAACHPRDGPAVRSGREVEGRRRDGSRFAMDMAVSEALVGGRRLSVAIVRDITERKRAEEVLRARTRDLESAQAQLTASAEFAAALNQSEVLATYRAALRSLSRTLGVPAAVVYAVGDDGRAVARCAVGLDSRMLDSDRFSGDGLPAEVARTGEIQTLAGPFDSSDLRIRVGLGEVELSAVVGWPIVSNRRCIGVLLTAHVSPPTADHRTFLLSGLDQLAIRMGGFRVEEQRARLLADLQAQSKALEAAKGEAERASRVKSEFLANMSHELRTPMNSIMGFTQRLIRKLGGTIQERELDALRTVDRNAKHLLGLINSILDLSKIEAGKMELQKVRLDLTAAIREVAEQGASLVDNKPVEVVLDLPEGPIHIDGDRVALKQMILNLLSNGIKYTDRGTVTIGLGVTVDDKLGQVARVAVRDTGVGIKPEDRGRLFRQFTQLDGSPTRKVGGTGLGLVITDQYVRMHGGRIDVASEYGRGSEFAVLLPLQAAPAVAETREAGPAPASTPILPEANGPSPPAEPAPATESGPTAAGVTILCVDDAPDILKYLQLTFQDVGYEVVLAGDHDGALRGARGRRPDLICLDLKMPGRDGFDVMRSLREDPELASVPILVVSAGGEERRAIGAGARSYLSKPVDADGLVAAVRCLLGSEVGGVLIVEDSPDTTELLASALVENGLTVRTAANGREGLDRLAEAVPSAIILDLMMPVMDGFAFLEQLKGHPDWERIPVVVLSAKILEPDERLGLRRSVAAILTKGGDDPTSVIDALLKAALPGRRLAREVAT